MKLVFQHDQTKTVVDVPIYHENTIEEAKGKIFHTMRNGNYHPYFIRFYTLDIGNKRVYFPPVKFMNGRYDSNEVSRIYEYIEDEENRVIFIETVNLNEPFRDIQKKFPNITANMISEAKSGRLPPYSFERITTLLEKENGIENALTRGNLIYRGISERFPLKILKMDYRILPRKKMEVDLVRMFNLFVTDRDFPFVSILASTNEPVSKVNDSVIRDKEKVRKWVISKRARNNLKSPKGLLIKHFIHFEDRQPDIVTFNVFEDGTITLKCAASAEDSKQERIIQCSASLAKISEKLNEYAIAIKGDELFSPFMYQNVKMDKIQVMIKTNLSFDASNTDVFVKGLVERVITNKGPSNMYRFTKGEIQKGVLNDSILRDEMAEDMDEDDIEEIGKILGVSVRFSIRKADGATIEVFSAKSFSHARLVIDYFLRSVMITSPNTINVFLDQSASTIPNSAKEHGLPTKTRSCQDDRKVKVTGTLEKMREHFQEYPHLVYYIPVLNENGDLKFVAPIGTSTKYIYPSVNASGYFCSYKNPDHKYARRMKEYWLDDFTLTEFNNPVDSRNIRANNEKADDGGRELVTTNPARPEQFGVLPKTLSRILNTGMVRYKRMGVDEGDIWECFYTIYDTNIRQSVVDFMAQNEGLYLTMKIKESLPYDEFMNILRNGDRNMYYVYAEAIAYTLNRNLMIFSVSDSNILCNGSFVSERNNKYILLLRQTQIGTFELIVGENEGRLKTVHQITPQTPEIQELRDLYRHSCRRQKHHMWYIKKSVEQIGPDILLGMDLPVSIDGQIVNPFSEVLFLTSNSYLIPVEYGHRPVTNLPIIPTRDLRKYKKSSIETIDFLKSLGMDTFKPFHELADRKMIVNGIVTQSGLVVPTLPSKLLEKNELPGRQVMFHYVDDLDDLIYADQIRPDKRNEILFHQKVKLFSINKAKAELSHYFGKVEPSLGKDLIRILNNPETTKYKKKNMLIRYIQEILGQRMGSPRKNRERSIGDVLVQEKEIGSLLCREKTIANECNASIGCGWVDYTVDQVNRIGKCRFEEPSNDMFTMYVFSIAEDILADPNRNILLGKIDLNRESSGNIFYVRPNEVLIRSVEDFRESFG